METWEIVLILGLVTISLMVLINHKLSSGVISILDNSVFQLAIVGLTLAVAVASPPVAIVAIATIVIVYYIRNLIKVQLIHNTECQVPDEDDETKTDNEPRLVVEEVKTVETTTTTQHIKIQESGEHDAQRVKNLHNMVNMHTGSNVPNIQAHSTNTPKEPVPNTKPEDKEVVESALKEHQYRVSGESQMFAKNYKIPGAAPVPDIKPLEQDNFPNPRTSLEGFNAESSDPRVEVNGSAPKAGVSSFIPDNKAVFSVDANIFTKGEPVPIEYNEMSAPPSNRPFSKNEGQYMINEKRPYSSSQKYELADFMPGNDMGSNDYTIFGLSIDDKITNLKKGIVTSTAPPPNFDEVVPASAQKLSN